MKKTKKTTEKPVNGLEQLHKVKEETINRWEKSGILDGLVGNSDVNMAAMFESKESYVIGEDDNSFCTDIIPLKVYTREEIIAIIKRYAFHLSDNGDPDESVKEWFDRCYPEEKIIPAK
jgi:hypothetical protein